MKLYNLCQTLILQLMVISLQVKYHLAVYNVDCDVYMATSTALKSGRGLFAGRTMKEYNLIEEAPTIAISADYTSAWSTHYFVFNSGCENRNLIVFGLGMLYNHQSDDLNNVEYDWSLQQQDCNKEKNSARSTSNYFSYDVNKQIEAGTELFADYGKQWFQDRSIVPIAITPQNASYSHDIEYLKAHGICMTHIYVSQSKLPMAGKGIFAKKAFQEGEVIYVSPVLLLPKHEVIEASNDSVLLNYCIAPLSEIDIAILPIGLSAMANHQGRQLANMAYRWTAESLKALEQDPKLLLKLPYAPLDLEYYALRDIAAEEELTLDYGEEWINAWATYLGTKLSFSLSSLLDKEHDMKFRHPIVLPKHLLPVAREVKKHTACNGSACSNDANLNASFSPRIDL